MATVGDFRDSPEQQLKLPPEARNNRSLIILHVHYSGQLFKYIFKLDTPFIIPVKSCFVIIVTHTLANMHCSMK